MPSVRKELLRPGTYYTSEGPVSFTKDDLVGYCRESNALLASGRAIPVPLEHQDDAVPLSRAERLAKQVLHNSGYVQSFGMGGGDGQSLEAVLDIENPDVWKNLSAIKFVSPEIRSRFDADGRTWRNVVTHVALTTKPVWSGQKPFPVPSRWVGDDGAVRVKPSGERLSLAGTLRLSLADAASEGDSYVLVRRGRDGESESGLQEQKEAAPPVGPGADPAPGVAGQGVPPSGDAGRLSLEDAMADDTKILPAAPPGGPGESVPPAPAASIPATNPAGDVMARLLDNLTYFKVPMPDGTDEKNFMERLDQALDVLRKADQMAGDGGADDKAEPPSPSDFEPGGKGGEVPPLQEEQPMSGQIAMSLEKKITDQDAKIAQLSLAHQQTADALSHMTEVAAQAKADSVCAHVLGLQDKGKLPKHKADSLRETVVKHKLGLVSRCPDSANISVVLGQIAMAEDVPDGTFLEKAAPPATAAAQSPQTAQLSLEPAASRVTWNEPGAVDESEERHAKLAEEFLSQVHLPGVSLNGYKKAAV